MTATRDLVLSQHDPEPERRRERVESRRGAYEYDHDTLPPLAVIRDVPPRENFSLPFTIGFLDTLASVALNLAGAKFRSFFDHFDELQDFSELFPLLTKPTVVDTWQEDWQFARQRIDGPNPVTLRRHERMSDDAVRICKASYQRRTGGDLQPDCEQGLLYEVDFPMLRDLPIGGWQGKRKHMLVPRAVFAWAHSGFRDLGQLVPISIHFDDCGEAWKTVTPDDYDRWHIAKTFFQIADANHFQMSTHLCRTHMVMEPFALATPRQLADNHPVHALLKPHLRFLLARNEEARNRLITPGTYVEELLASSLAGSLEIVRRSFEEWSFHGHAFPREIAARGVADDDMLPDYPFRDDGLLLWHAITKYVGEYVDLFYKDAGDIVGDTELQEWARELSDPLRGNIKDLTADGQLNSVDKLKEIITQVIFTCGPLHSAVNFAQWDYMAYVPNAPFAAFHHLDKSADLMAYLPPQDLTAKQIEIIGALALYRHDRLGYYDETFAANSQELDVLHRFQIDLDRVEREIDRRNGRKRRRPYPYMKPSLVLNSISV